MPKWADYCIVAVKYDSNRSCIAQVKALPDGGESLGGATFLDRATVVSAIQRGTTFVTAYASNGNYKRGEDVRVVQIGNERFIRTDANSVRADNLGNLPEYG